jgi:tRNA 2-thiouridine synthesizing protein A
MAPEVRGDRFRKLLAQREENEAWTRRAIVLKPIPPTNMPPSRPAHEMVLDLRGLNCPQPVLRAKKALGTIPVGGVLVLECTDPLTVIDVPHFVKQTGHALEAQERRGPLYVFRIAKRK